VIKIIRLLVMMFVNADIIGTNMRMRSANVECQMTLVMAFIRVLGLYCHKE
jgi:hydrogenase/urease accessory protein HupE